MEMTHFVTDILAGNIKMPFISPESNAFGPLEGLVKEQEKTNMSCHGR